MKKRSYYYLAGGFALVLLLVWLTPKFFAGAAKEKVLTMSEKYVNAKITFKDIDLSLLSSFPDLEVGLENFEIHNKAPFEGDTLLKAKTFEICINFWSVFSDEIIIKSIDIEEPDVYVRVLKDGRANYDIAIPDNAAKPITEEEGSSKIALDSWKITNGTIRYSDASLPCWVSLKGFNHSGSGELDSDLFDLVTQTDVDSLSLNFDNINYFNKNKLSAKVIMDMNMATSTYKFKENNIKINDFAFSFAGMFAMPASGYDMDITFKAAESEFKNLLSLIPAVFMEGYESIKTSGSLVFEGFAKGTYDDTKNKMPAFGLKMGVKNGFLQYPDLPSAVQDIQMSMNIDNKDGNLENTTIDIQQFALKLGSNPVSGRLKLKGLTDYWIDADINAKVNLAELKTMFPMDSLDMKGLFGLNLKANGLYSEAKSVIPNINAKASLQQGYLKHLAYPIPMENIEMDATASNTSGKMADTSIELNKLILLVDKNPFEINGSIVNLDDYTYDLKVKGLLDLGKITKIYPIEKTTITGQMAMDLITKGKMSDIEASKYDKLPTSGKMSLKNFKYKSEDLPQGFNIDASEMTFTPERLIITSFLGSAGKSDLNITGHLLNYLAYGFHATGLKETPAILVGNMSLKSRKFDVNEWLAEEEAASTTTEEPLTVFEVPKDIDFTFNANIEEVLYDNLTLKNMTGTIIAKNGTVRMNNLIFNTLGGTIRTSGLYDSRNLAKPLFDFDLDILEMGLGNAAQNFNTVQTFAPVAKNVEGIFNTKFKMKGGLKQDMMPDLLSLTGGGSMLLKQASFKQDPLMKSIIAQTGLKSLENSTLMDLIMQFSIENGRMFVKPYSFALGECLAGVEGSTGVDGSIDYKMMMMVPKSLMASKIQDWFSLDVSKAQLDHLDLHFTLKGSYAQPRVSFDKTLLQNQIKAAIKAEVKEEVTEQGKELLEDILADTTNKNLKDKVKDQLKDRWKKIKNR
ncbi:MAG: AsmA family protein [Cytophagales bacterium]|nr:MAG: AsmA family protein [Cytophagales bacterium]